MLTLQSFNSRGEHIHNVILSFTGGALHLRVQHVDGRDIQPHHVQFHTSSQAKRRLDGLSVSYLIGSSEYLTAAAPVQFLLAETEPLACAAD